MRGSYPAGGAASAPVGAAEADDVVALEALNEVPGVLALEGVDGVVVPGAAARDVGVAVALGRAHPLPDVAEQVVDALGGPGLGIGADRAGALRLGVLRPAHLLRVGIAVAPGEAPGGAAALRRPLPLFEGGQSLAGAAAVV